MICFLREGKLESQTDKHPSLTARVYVVPVWCVNLEAPEFLTGGVVWC